MFRLITALIAITFSLTGQAFAQSAGTWQTDMGAMTLQQNGSSVTGTYATDNGKIVGTMRANVLDGIWIEDGSSQRCAKPAPDGRYYWGRIRFTFQEGRFTGAWSYCDGAIVSANAWNGTRGGAPAPEPLDDNPRPPRPAAAASGGAPHWQYLRTTTERPTQEQLGPDCRLNTADARERGMRFDYVCKTPGGEGWHVAGNLDFSIRMPAALVPGAKVFSNGRLTATGGAQASISGNCWIGIEGSGGAYLLNPLSATGSESVSAEGEGVIPGPPWCTADGTCPNMVVICTMSSTQQFTMTRIYGWVR